MKKSLMFAAIAALMASSAFATGTGQTVNSTAVNHGQINNTVSTSAAVQGLGTSYSTATGAAGASSSAVVATGVANVKANECTTIGGAVSSTGKASTYVNGTAFNVSTGTGTGSASSVGTAKADSYGSANYSAPGQWVSVAGAANTTSTGNVKATTNTGGTFDVNSTGTYTAVGNVGSKVCSIDCGAGVTKAVTGSVTDMKSSNSFAGTGSMIVDGKLVNQAPTNGSATSNVTVTGAYGDPL